VSSFYSGSPAALALITKDQKLALGVYARSANDTDSAIVVENSAGLYDRAGWRRSTDSNIHANYADAFGRIHCQNPACQRDVTDSIMIFQKGKPKMTVGYDRDHFGPLGTWSERVITLQYGAKQPSRKYVIDIFHLDIRPLCRACNRSHIMEGL